MPSWNSSSETLPETDSTPSMRAVGMVLLRPSRGCRGPSLSVRRGVLAVGQLHADGDLVRRADLLDDRFRAVAERVNLLAHFGERRGGALLEGVTRIICPPTKSTLRLSPLVTASAMPRRHQQQAHRGERHAPAQKPDVGAVGNELEQFHGSSPPYSTMSAGACGAASRRPAYGVSVTAVQHREQVTMPMNSIGRRAKPLHRPGRWVENMITAMLIDVRGAGALLLRATRRRNDRAGEIDMTAKPILFPGRRPWRP